MDHLPPIVIVTEPIDAASLRARVEVPHGTFVKFVADLGHDRIALGGVMHADAESVLLDAGGAQQDLWGGNYLPGAGPADCIEYTSLINIRPSQGNRGMELLDAALRSRIESLVFRLIGRGEPLS